MKQLLLELLDMRDPSRVTVNNCINLVQRDSYKPPRPAKTHEELLTRARDKALDTAQDLEGALLTASVSHLDHSELLGRISDMLDTIDSDLLKPTRKDYHAGLAMMRDRLRTLLIEHESSRQQRALRRA